MQKRANRLRRSDTESVPGRPAKASRRQRLHQDARPRARLRPSSPWALSARSSLSQSNTARAQQSPLELLVFRIVRDARGAANRLSTGIRKSRRAWFSRHRTNPQRDASRQSSVRVPRRRPTGGGGVAGAIGSAGVGGATGGSGGASATGGTSLIDAAKDGAGASSGGAGGSGTGGTGGSTADGGSVCGPQISCVDCCMQLQPDGANEYAIYFSGCACTTTTCNDPCLILCAAGEVFVSDCVRCIDSHTECDNGQSQCASSATCAPYSACIHACP